MKFFFFCSLLWNSQSLCNACGIRFRKQRRSELLGIRIIHSHKDYKKINPSPSSLSFSHGGVSLKKRRILKEEEQAALCLLLLSRNSAFAWQKKQSISLKRQFCPLFCSTLFGPVFWEDKFSALKLGLFLCQRPGP